MIVLIIGLGSIAKKHILALRNIGDFEIYALRTNSSNVEVYEDVKNIFHISEVIDKIDFIILSSPTFLHAKQISELLCYKKPLFIEKPPISDLIDLEGMDLNFEDVPNYVACNLRFHPVLQFLKQQLPNKRINEVNIYAGSYLPDWRPGKDFRKIYSANKHMGGGVHLDLFHELDYTSWLFGKPLKTASFLSSNSSLNIDAVDYANLIWQYNNYSINILMNYYRRQAKRQIEIVFEHDIWVVDLLSCTILKNGNEILFNSPFDIMDTYIHQMEYFLNCLKNNIQPMNSFDEAVQNLKYCLNPNYEIK